MDILQEITPLTPDKLYSAHYYFQNQLDFPLHFHDDYELNLTANVKGRRIVGSLVEDFTDYDLALMFPNVIHCYKRVEGETCEKSEVTVVQFSRDMSEWRIINTAQFAAIKEMLSKPVSGLKFSTRIAHLLKGKIESIAERSDFAGGIRFLEVLSFLANVDPSEVSVIGGDNSEVKFSRSRRISKIIKFVEQNYHRKITLDEVGQLVSMSPTSVSRFFKIRTGHNFYQYLTDYRMECAQRMLANTDMNVSEVAYDCGFNSLSNFNKVFREQVGQTPRDFRVKYKNSATK